MYASSRLASICASMCWSGSVVVGAGVALGSDIVVNVSYCRFILSGGDISGSCC